MAHHEKLTWFLLLATAGCTANVYEIAISPDGPEFERSVRAWQSKPDAPLSQEQLQRLSAEYRQTIPEPDQHRYTFSNRFREHPPQDVGGHGSYLHFSSPCGSVTAYFERFRGSDDAVAELEARKQSIDTFVELLTGWFRTEVGSDPDFPKLQQYLETTLRHDLANVSTYLYFAQVQPTATEQAASELPLRVVQYLLERDYVRPEELPRWTRTVMTDDRIASAALLQRGLARKLGTSETDPIPALLSGLSDWDAMERSLRNYLRQRPEFAPYEKSRAEEQGHLSVDPLDLLFTPLTRALWPQGLFRAHDKVVVDLKLTRPPKLTNGKWNPEANVVNWNFDVETADTQTPHEFPRFCYVLWAVPDTEYQVAHFGTVLLDDETLAQYCLWYAGLTPAEAHEWDEALHALKPGPEFPHRLRAFRFSTEQAPAAANNWQVKPLAQHTVELILQQLEASRTTRTFEAD